MKPKLRFKEFSDEYVLSDLGKYLIQYKKTTNSNNQYPVLTSSRSGIFFQEDYFNRQVASKDNTGYNIVPRNYFTYRHMSDDTIFSFNINTLCDYGIVSTLYPVFTTNTEMNSNYLKEYLNNSKRFSEYCLLQKQGGSRTYMYFDKLKKFVGCFPSIQEQTKVSNFLSLIDKKIDLQSKKIEDLKLFKKGLDIKIFNNKKLFDIGIIKEYFESDGGTALEKYIDEKGTHNIISIGNYTPDGKYYDNGQKVIYNEKTKMKLLSKNNLAMILNDKTTTGDIIGSTILIDEDNKYIYNQRTQKLICKNINAEYSWCFFNSKYFRDKVFRLSQGGTQIYVNYSQIENQKIFIPKNKKIENDIVKSIFLITELIDKENDKFLKLQKLKKGFMQNMFV